MSKSNLATADQTATPNSKSPTGGNQKKLGSRRATPGRALQTGRNVADGSRVTRFGVSHGSEQDELIF
jgi:hypothetical protein